MKRRNNVKLMMMAGILAWVTSGCGNAAEQGTAATSGGELAKKVSTEPITISFYNPVGIADSYFEQYINAHIKKHFPHITVHYIKSEKGKMIGDLITAGQIPDMIVTTAIGIPALAELGILEDLTPHIKAHNINLGGVDKAVIDTIKTYSMDGKMLAMPWGINGGALYYNKDIFDRFGLAYPKDGMTWDQLPALAKQLSRTDGGQIFRGFDMNYGYLLGFNQLSVPFVDSKTDKAIVNNDKWKQIFNELSAVYKVPGNEVDAKTKGDVDSFIVDKNVAMRAGNSMFPRLIDEDIKGNKMNWDIVSLPTFKEKPDTGIMSNVTIFTMSSQTKYKDQIMQILNLMLSDEVQLEGSRIARQTIMTSKEIENAFGKDSQMMTTKNIAAVTKNKVAPAHAVTKYDDIAKSVLNQKFDAVRKGTKDINTALREAEEEINKKIEEEKAKKK